MAANAAKILSNKLEFDKPLCNEVFRDIIFTHARRERNQNPTSLRRAA